MEQALFCRACGAQLTEPVVVLSGQDSSGYVPEHADRLPLSTRGSAYKSDEPIMRAFGDSPAPLEFTPQFWVNPEDLTDRVSNTSNRRRLNGCCGLDGQDGPNQVCRCGAEVGTLQNDCWTPFVFIPNPDTTHWADFPDDIPSVIP